MLPSPPPQPATTIASVIEAPRLLTEDTFGRYAERAQGIVRHRVRTRIDV